MKSAVSIAAVCCLFAVTLLFGQGAAPNPSSAEILKYAYTIAPEIPGVIARGTKVQMIATGLQGTEGPIAAPDGSLLFTGSNAIIKIDKEDKVSTFLEPTNGAHCLVYDSKGRLIAVETGRVPGGKAQVGVLAPTRITLADNYNGRPFGFMNDLAISSKTDVIYFTDSGENVDPNVFFGERRDTAFFTLKPDGQLIKWSDDLTNGIAFPSSLILSPDEKLLYVNDLYGQSIYVFDVQPDGSLRNRRLFGKIEDFDPGVRPYADGMTVDAAGRLYVTTELGIHVFSPQGKQLGRIPLAPRPCRNGRYCQGPQNVAFAGPDKKILYVVGFGVAWKVPTLTQGFLGRAK